jgi:hypothetical protein
MSYIGGTGRLFPIVSLTSHPRREQWCPRSNMSRSARRGLESLIWQLSPESDFGMSRQAREDLALPVFMNSHWWKLVPPRIQQLPSLHERLVNLDSSSMRSPLSEGSRHVDMPNSVLYAPRFVKTRHEQDRPGTRLAHHIREAVDAPVAGPIRDNQRRVVSDGDEAWRIAARACVDATITRRL